MTLPVKAKRSEVHRVRDCVCCQQSDAGITVICLQTLLSHTEDNLF